jgi:putative nucleotidyltransferase with HDIG domain
MQGVSPGNDLMPARSQRLLVAEALILLGTLVAAVASSDAPDWRPAELVVVLLGLALVSDLLALQHSTQRITGAFFALVLAMALCGPAPAVLIGIVSVLVDSLRRRLAWHKLLTNVTVYAVIPLLGGLAIEWLGGVTDLETNNLTFAFVVFGAFVLANVLNFLMIAGDISVHLDIPVSRQAREVFVPVLPSELAGAVLTVSIAILYRETGVAALALLALVLVVFQYLIRELLRSQRRAEELAALQLGVLASMVETLALRDRMTARHSAAVARYSRALALAHGCDRDQQDLAHTAGLLHDIGKFSFPDSILLAEQPLTDDDWRIVHRHPEEGARVVARMEAYGPVADIILGHHERWDGQGYPRGLMGEAIPLLSRVIMIADTYDVMIARDSYRRPRTSAEAISELRRVAGSQLDPELVDTFVELLGNRGLRFRHADDADFEAELAFERRVRRYARPGRVFA